MPEPGHTFGGVAIRDDALFISDFSRFGVGVWRRSGSTDWYRADNLRTAGDFTPEGFFGGFSPGDALVKSDQYVFVTRWNADRGAVVVNVFQPDMYSWYRHVAILVAKEGYDLNGSISVSGRGVLVGGANGPYYFELPESFAQPALFQDTFASGNGRDGPRCRAASSRWFRAAIRACSARRARPAKPARYSTPTTGPTSRFRRT